MNMKQEMNTSTKLSSSKNEGFTQRLEALTQKAVDFVISEYGKDINKLSLKSSYDKRGDGQHSITFGAQLQSGAKILFILMFQDKMLEDPFEIDRFIVEYDSVQNEKVNVPTWFYLKLTEIGLGEMVLNGI